MSTSIVATRPVSGTEHPVARGGYFSGADLLFADARVTLLLLREGRDRACARLFGVSQRDAGIVTIIVLATLADAADRKVHRVLKAIRPRAGDAVIAEGVLRASYHWIAGPASRQVPVIGSLLFATVLLRPVLRLSLHDLRVAGHELRVDFDRRYGHLVRPNRRPSIQGRTDHRIGTVTSRGRTRS